jgi:hypothetical protein
VDSLISFKNLRSSDRRTGSDRRHFSYAFYIPERRSVEEVEAANGRRSGSDRRINGKPVDPNKTDVEIHNEEMQ